MQGFLCLGNDREARWQLRKKGLIQKEGLRYSTMSFTTSSRGITPSSFSSLFISACYLHGFYSPAEAMCMFSYGFQWITCNYTKKEMDEGRFTSTGSSSR